MSAPASAGAQHPVATASRAAGLALAATAVPGNPWIIGALREHPVNYADVMQTYMLTALLVGGLFIGLSAVVARWRQLESLGLLILVSGLLLIADRALLAYWGLPYWIPDSRLYYRHRPSTERVNTAHNARVHGSRISINRHGFHDENFPVEKAPQQTRILFLGDSVTMGWGIEYQRTFSFRVQRLLQSAGAAVHTLNAGVEGYAAVQERRMLEDCLVFAPDHVVLGFVMNDVIDPLKQQHRGFWGLYRHSSNALGYMANETGIGRSLQKFRQTRFEGTMPTADRIGAFVAADPQDPRFAGAWRETLEHIRAMDGECRRRGIGFTLVVFPETHQLFHPERQHPQRILAEFAAQHTIDFLDLTPAFESFLAATINSRFAPGHPPLDPQRFRDMADVMATAFFLDEVHLADAGHEVVAVILAERFGQDDMRIDDAALTHILNQAARLTLEPVVRMPAALDQVWRYGRALDHMGYAETACSFYHRAGERFAAARAEIDAQMRLLNCGDL